MRLIGTVETEKKAFAFYSFLLERGIHSSYEKDPQQQAVAIWIYEEDAIDEATALLEEFKENPNDPKFTKVEFPLAPPQPPDHIVQKKIPEINSAQIKVKRRPSFPITYGVILICVILYLFNSMQQYNRIKADGKLAAQIGFTPIQQYLMFDYPKSNQAIDELLKTESIQAYNDPNQLPPAFTKASQIPTWRGIMPILINKFKKIPPSPSLNGPLFVQIREGQVWRLFTPSLLHAGLLHIFFNMAWALILLRQVEVCLSKSKTILFILLVGIVSNLAQYFVSGPYFLGFSGIVTGLVGFIWVRQKIAPWEGYPLHRSTIIFILVFVLAMFALEIISMITAFITAKEISANIANTAHIIGGLFGALLARFSFFARRAK